jgi:hypothetical protein
MIRRLRELPALGIAEIPRAFELDRSRLDYNPLGSEEFISFFLDATRLVRKRLPNRKRARDWDDRDWGHLHAHLLADRDVFLTSDQAILCLEPELRGRFNIRVMSPSEYLHGHLTDFPPIAGNSVTRLDEGASD